MKAATLKQAGQDHHSGFPEALPLNISFLFRLLIVANSSENRLQFLFVS